MARWLLAVLVALHIGDPSRAHAQEAPAVVSLGTCRLASGATIEDCRIAYRTFGRLDANGTNAVLIPPWMLGRSESGVVLLGRDGLVDTTRYFAILVDALGDGVSSSPSNTTGASRGAFAGLTIADMVDAQHRLVVEHLKLTRLHAVVGISMGGMQAFEWAVRYPAFVDVVVPISGTPQAAPWDRVLWTALLSEIDNGRARGASVDSVWTQLWRFMSLTLSTPAKVNESTPADATREVVASADLFRRTWSLDDFAAELRAATHQDVAAAFGGDLSRAAAQVRARMLIIYSWDDHTVTAGPSATFARLIHADTLSVPSACGHGAAGCEHVRVNAAVREFLARPQ